MLLRWKLARTSLDDLQTRDGNDESAAPIPYAGHLGENLFADVPRKDQHVIRPSFPQFVRMVDGNVRPRQVLSLLVRADVHRIIEEVRSNSAIVEERVGLRGRAIPGDTLPLAFRVDEKTDQIALDLFDLGAERSIGVRVADSARLFPFAHRLNLWVNRLAIRGVPDIEPQRAAVGRKLFHIEYGEVVTS